MYLKTLDGKKICVVGSYFNLRMQLKFNEVSEATFDVPARANGMNTPYYDRITGKKHIDLYPYGIFILNDPEIDSDGIREVKTCSAKSLEHELSHKNIVIAKGTYAFYNPISPANTIIGMIQEIAPNWSIGRVDPELMSKFRTFDNIDSNLLTFMLETLQELYDIVFIFDTYKREISVHIGATQVQNTPIFLSFDNLLKNVQNKQLSNEIKTVVRVYGAAPLTINNVNPLGTNKIYNIDYFIENGDVPKELAVKWREWQKAYSAAIHSYTNISVLRNVARARHTAESARLTDMKGELTSLENLRAVVIQSIAKRIQEQKDLDAINVKITAQERVIKTQNELLATIQVEVDAHIKEGKSINESIKFEAFFSTEELNTLQSFFIEGTFTDSTFATVDTGSYTDKGSTQKMDIATVDISDCKLTEISLPSGTQKRIIEAVGGNLNVAYGDVVFKADLISGTMERKDDGNCVWSFYVGSGSIAKDEFPSGNVTFVCKSAAFDNIPKDSLNLQITDAFMYFTKNVTEYQAFSVERELFDYATKELENLSYPSYQFTVDSGNIIFLKDYEKFKDALQLGSSINLKLNDDLLIKPMLLEISLDFENPADFEFIFSNEFKRPDNVTRMRSFVRKASSSAANLDVNRHGFANFLDSGAKSALDGVLNGATEAAKNAILAGENQAVKIDGTGIKIGTTVDGILSPEQIALTNSMLALTKDNWDTASVGIGKFASPSGGEYWGVNAEIIGGNMLIGKNLHLENLSPDGKLMQFKVDASGASLYNSQFLLESDTGGAMLIDPEFGFAIGANKTGYPLWDRNEDGTPSLNKENATLYTDLDGTLNLKNINATGKIYGSILQGNEMYVGGDNTAANCKFGVDAMGNLIGMETQNGKMKFDSNGNATFDADVNISGNLNMTGNITWGADTFPVQSQYSVNGVTDWHKNMVDADMYKRDMIFDGAWGMAYKFRGKDGSDASVPSYITATKITQTTIESPQIYGGNMFGGAYWDLNGKTKLMLNPSDYGSNCADMALYSGASRAFHVYDKMSGTVSLNSFNSEFMSVGQWGTILYGDWDFSNAKVTGLSVPGHFM